jgi:hypothetical protein
MQTAELTREELIEENLSLKRRINALELKIELIEKALVFLAERIDATDQEIGLTANTEYLLRHILQK